MITLFVGLMFLIMYRTWYLIRHTSKKQLKHKGKLVHTFTRNKCHECKKDKDTMYYLDAWHGRIYKCHDCASKS